MKKISSLAAEFEKKSSEQAQVLEEALTHDLKRAEQSLLAYIEQSQAKIKIAITASEEAELERLRQEAKARKARKNAQTLTLLLILSLLSLGAINIHQARQVLAYQQAAKALKPQMRSIETNTTTGETIMTFSPRTQARRNAEDELQIRIPTTEKGR